MGDGVRVCEAVRGLIGSWGRRRVCEEGDW